MLWQWQQKVTVNVVWSHPVLGAEIKQRLGGSEACCKAPVAKLGTALLPLEGVLKAGLIFNQARFSEHFNNGRECPMGNGLACEALGAIRAIHLAIAAGLSPQDVSDEAFDSCSELLGLLHSLVLSLP